MAINQMSITSKRYPDKKMTLVVSSMGCAIMKWIIEDKGMKRDIVLGFEDEDTYKTQDKYIGVMVGQVANRIKQGKFKIDDEQYQLQCNNGPNALHGSHVAYHEQEWSIIKIAPSELVYVLYSEDLSAGFPGNVMVQVSYKFIETAKRQLALVISEEAYSDKKTIINLTQHTYFNLKGHETNTLEGHELLIRANRFQPIDQDGLPTGEVRLVNRTPFDFRRKKNIMDWLRKNKDDEQIMTARGIDHNFCFKDNTTNPLETIAILSADDISMECKTTKSGMQVYTANYLDETPGKKDDNGQVVLYKNQSAICLEMQAWPDAPNHESYPSICYGENEWYKQQTVYALTF